MQRQFLRTDEVSTILGVPITTIQRWCREGRISAIQPGRKLLIPIFELARLQADLAPLTDDQVHKAARILTQARTVVRQEHLNAPDEVPTGGVAA